MTNPTSAMPPSRDEIGAWLIDWISREAEVPTRDIDLAQSLLDYSLSSITATILVGDIEEWLGLALPPTLAWDHPTITALIDYLAEECALADEEPEQRSIASG